MNKAQVLSIWLSLPLSSKLDFYAAGKLKGIGEISIAQLFPEKPLVEKWLTGQLLFRADNEFHRGNTNDV